MWCRAVLECAEELILTPWSHPLRPCRETKRSKGIAYVMYVMPEDAVRAYQELDGVIFQVGGPGPGVSAFWEQQACGRMPCICRHDCLLHRVTWLTTSELGPLRLTTKSIDAPAGPAAAHLAFPQAPSLRSPGLRPG